MGRQYYQRKQLPSGQMDLNTANSRSDSKSRAVKKMQDVQEQKSLPAGVIKGSLRTSASKIFSEEIKMKNNEAIQNTLFLTCVLNEEKESIQTLAKEFFGVQIKQIQGKESTLCFEGKNESNVKKLISFFQECEKLLQKREPISAKNAIKLMKLFKDSPELEPKQVFDTRIRIQPEPGRVINVFPKTKGQFDLIQKLRSNTLNFAIGPAGTGKTYLAVAYGLELLYKPENGIEKLVIARPVVEAGENLGFLPGDIKDKTDPYLTPIRDSADDLIKKPEREKLESQERLVVCAIAYMRGRTLKNTYVIVDEGQNATLSQLRLFIERLGEGSQITITGDPNQRDRKDSGLQDVLDVISRSTLNNSITYFNKSDVQRSLFVKEFVEIFEKDDQEKSKQEQIKQQQIQKQIELENKLKNKFMTEIIVNEI